MLKSVLIIPSILFLLSTLTHGSLSHLHRRNSSLRATFLQAKASLTHPVNPLKLFFTVVHRPDQTPPYSIEWNLALLKTMILESSYVSEEDKRFFLQEFGNFEHDYSDWSAEQRDQLERFTEIYFNIYQSPESFLPFVDCPVLTSAIMDEKLKDLRTDIDEEKRFKARAKAIERLC